MTEEDRQVFHLVAARLKEKFPPAKIWAFGSRVRGEAQEGSDLDICIVLPVWGRADYEIIRGIAWEVGFEHDRVITTVVFEEADFTRGPSSESSLVANILREGLAA